MLVDGYILAIVSDKGKTYWHWLVFVLETVLRNPCSIFLHFQFEYYKRFMCCYICLYWAKSYRSWFTYIYVVVQIMLYTSYCITTSLFSSQFQLQPGSRLRLTRSNTQWY